MSFGGGNDAVVGPTVREFVVFSYSYINQSITTNLYGAICRERIRVVTCALTADNNGNRPATTRRGRRDAVLTIYWLVLLVDDEVCRFTCFQPVAKSHAFAAAFPTVSSLDGAADHTRDNGDNARPAVDASTFSRLCDFHKSMTHETEIDAQSGCDFSRHFSNNCTVLFGTIN